MISVTQAKGRREIASCPCLFIGAVASGQGKTSVTAGIARYHSRRGRRVRVFKTGPDFLDPQVLEVASGASVFNLDCWMVGLDESKRLLAQAARDADLILIEGAMGLYDGDPSGADLAAALGVPVAAVIDASAMAETFGAIAHGLSTYRPLAFAGVIANRVAGEGHARMLAASLDGRIALLASFAAMEHPLAQRHLGLLQAREQAGLEEILERLAEPVGRSRLAELPPAVEFEDIDRRPAIAALNGRTVAVARDEAFSFLYPANLACLVEMGARLRFFSPLADEAVPAADALYLPGGYPELHAARLAGNARWRRSVRSFVQAGRPVVAECGGFMALAEAIVACDGRSHAMAGILPGQVRMRDRLAAIGLQAVRLPQGEMRGHTFHYSQFVTSLEPCAKCEAHGYGIGENCYRVGSVWASYLHAYFPSNPAAAAALFGATA